MRLCNLITLSHKTVIQRDMVDGHGLLQIDLQDRLARAEVESMIIVEATCRRDYQSNYKVKDSD